MLNIDSPLILEFLKDHQQFSRLLQQISKLLDQDRMNEARERARELDALAGPHIAYEEAELYPRLAELGEQSATECLLVGQHHDALSAVTVLIENDPLTREQLTAVKNGFQRIVEHAEHCGTLIGLMSRLDDEQQAQSLTELKRLRSLGRKWTDQTVDN